MYLYKLLIKEVRKGEKISPNFIADELGISRSYFWYLENDKYPITLRDLCQVASILNVHPCELFEFIY